MGKVKKANKNKIRKKIGLELEKDNTRGIFTRYSKTNKIINIATYILVILTITMLFILFMSGKWLEILGKLYGNS